MNASRYLLAAGFGILATIGVQATAAVQSPFLPAPGSVAAPVENSPIELRGIFPRAQGVKFCIYDTVRKTSMWVGLNEKGYDFLIKAQDVAKETVTIEQGGRTFPLKLREVKVAAGPVAMPLPVGPGAPPVAGPNPVTQNVVLNPTQADDAKRLEDTVSEIQRRRALREAQTTGTPAVATPAGQVATPPAVQAGGTPATQQAPAATGMKR